jgi:hypothetical protein
MAGKDIREQRGVLHFKNCDTGCEFHESFKQMQATMQNATYEKFLKPACDSCQLSSGPCWEASLVRDSYTAGSMLPDADAPYWYTSGIGYLKMMRE